MKQIVWFILELPFLRPWFLRFFAWLNSMTYFLVSHLSVLENSGVHPKHNIIKYEDWFLGKIALNDRVLDVGSHEGKLVSALAKRAEKVVGIEINQKSHLKAKSNVNLSNVNFVLGDATQMDLSVYGDFSVVTLSNVLEHIEQRVDFLRRLIANVGWKDQPRFLIRVPTIERDWISVYKRELGVEWRLDKTHFVEHTLDELLNEVSRANLLVIDSKIAFGEIFIECRGKNA